MPSVRGLQACLICLLTLGGCASVQQEAQRDTSIEGSLPSSVELEETPFFPQTKYHCGPAALATVLQAHAVNVTPDALIAQVYLPGRKGSLQIEMIAAARQHHALPYVLETSFSNLLTEVAAGNPVLVLQNLGLSWLPRWHYAVVVGYDLNKEELTLRSGTLKRRRTSFPVFKRTWQRADAWALVVVPAGEVPATANLSAYLKTALVFEETGMVEQALLAYHAATKRWPDQSEAWLMSGNMAYSARQVSRAITDYQEAAELSPKDSRIWNNLAYALREQGCSKQAMEALRHALRIAPNDLNLKDSLKEFEETIPEKASSRCDQNPDDGLTGHH
ncbi:hypothetical protein MNBD_GAMMA15-401 [hydrothermal vent metagenome]|uniref:Peptidase C39-like domain-containing protein n=1 Tax=hydrothermal vent metagenome TaxID=652676 RepID=A0A3B0Y929_9ZZZZ